MTTSRSSGREPRQQRARAGRRTARGSRRSRRRRCGGRTACRSPRGWRRSGRVGGRRHRRLDLVHAVIVARRVDGARDARARRTGPRSCRSPTTGMPGRLQPIEQRRRERRQREVAAVRRALEAARARRRTAARSRGRRPAPSPTRSKAISQMRYSSSIGIDVFVRGDLEHAVGRRVDDRRAGPHVLGPELVDDRRAGRDRVAERRRGRCAARTRAITLGGKAVGKRRKRPVEHQPHQLPVPGHRVLAGRRLRHAAERAERRRRPVAADVDDARRAERAQRGHAQRRPPRRCCRACCCPRRRRRRRPAARRCRRCRGR